MWSWLHLSWLKAGWNRYAKLEERVSGVEKRIADELAHNSVRRCLGCGAREFYVVDSVFTSPKPYGGTIFNHNSATRTYRCKACGFQETYRESPQYPKD